jgi:hypothetical protein
MQSKQIDNVLDPTTAQDAATKNYADGIGLPTGGTVGQFLKKNSATNFDAVWDQNVAVQDTTVTATAGTVSTAGIMAGLGASVTPSTTGRLLLMISGYQTSSVAGAFSACLGFRYGTGTAPVHGAAVAGTAVPNCPNTYAHSTTANATVPFSIQAILTGLTVGTTYWIDVWYGSSSASSTAKLNTVAICIAEI